MSTLTNLCDAYRLNAGGLALYKDFLRLGYDVAFDLKRLRKRLGYAGSSMGSRPLDGRRSYYPIPPPMLTIPNNRKARTRAGHVVTDLHIYGNCIRGRYGPPHPSDPTRATSPVSRTWNADGKDMKGNIRLDLVFDDAV